MIPFKFPLNFLNERNLVSFANGLPNNRRLQNVVNILSFCLQKNIKNLNEELFGTLQKMLIYYVLNHPGKSGFDDKKWRKFILDEFLIDSSEIYKNKNFYRREMNFEIPMICVLGLIKIDRQTVLLRFMSLTSEQKLKFCGSFEIRQTSDLLINQDFFPVYNYPKNIRQNLDLLTSHFDFPRNFEKIMPEKHYKISTNSGKGPKRKHYKQHVEPESFEPALKKIKTRNSKSETADDSGKSTIMKSETSKVLVENFGQFKSKLFEKDQELNNLHTEHDKQDEIIEKLLQQLTSVENILNSTLITNA